ncbi:MAG: SUF system Fe-S cluster assembly protein [Azospira oryzae]|uniref:SUF system Fe-S cluster assembly protein n=1 Tax=Pelomicrobium methylotrophicum TaxID=2602750 RepID=A0A5C7EUG5_9PROT|nr:SUF system Fe-S cluster assembly protein [Pelomicrobium methylotrophicum]PZP56764.1 MAG: SUF system Fe-S cluster assembly protein [Azospira oryzae]PZP78661.1 MAG: SUF system Fe-S cluster assembly protein [Azospira oryzae]TXF12390.1 SUF system Fe-S cluster assembly protein [Pelomicrobium methylotrophicum]
MDARWEDVTQKQDVSIPQEALEQQVIAALREIYDPEIPVNIYDLGLVYALEVEPSGEVAITMTLTAPGCPVAQTFPDTVRERVSAVEGVKDVKVELTWEPPWTMERMSEAAKLQLGML